MTNITGKIYQMKNADGTENRFPRTVIEAVLGLSSYLQDQFSSLADIYMPIEGIYEALTGQEFVFRKSPNTIKAKSLTIDRIKGKTIAWNQLTKLSDWNSLNSHNVTLNNGIFTVNNTGADTYFLFNKQTPIANHKYYLSAICTVPSGITTKYGFPSANTNIKTLVNGKNSWLITYSSGTLVLDDYYASSYAGTTFKDLMLIDLTLMFGAGNEPSTVEEFEALYPGYHDYSDGKLISNDAKQLETVGRNVWDEEWEVGGINSNTGAPISDAKIRPKNKIRLAKNATYYVKAPVGLNIYEYDAAGNYLGYTEVQAGATFVANCEQIAFSTLGSSITTYNHDICINLSDESFNGQYEPYRKSVLPLNLDDFWVKDGQDNRVHITGGLKSAGSVCDEIVGNKYIKRVGSVDMGSLSWNESSADISIFRCSLEELSNIKPAPYSSSLVNAISARYTQKAYSPLQQSDNLCFSISDIHNNRAVFINRAYTDTVAFKTAMSGVMLYYELTTPIEYDLVEPLIYTMKAGTTEERISPNEDGLSAPFCCDMTYSANENNDAGNAKYAATAGRLLNSHKIWGQDFNGTQDINGNLVSNGILQGTQLKSTVSTGTAPLTVASTTMVQNLVAEKASKLLTARTIWGKSFDGSGDISGAISNITTLSASGLATIAGGIALGTSTKAQAAKMVWSEDNNAWHLQGNLCVDGFVTAGGINNQE